MPELLNTNYPTSPKRKHIPLDEYIASEEILSHLGETHNYLTINGFVRKFSGNRYRNFYTCRCKCGTVLDVRTDAVLAGTTKSCGCAQKESASITCIARNTIHGLYHTNIHTSWRNMRSRCNNERNNRYRLYGGRGIKVCDDWNDSKNVGNVLMHSEKER